MTPQQQADAALACWNANRHLPPSERANVSIIWSDVANEQFTKRNIDNEQANQVANVPN